MAMNEQEQLRARIAQLEKELKELRKKGHRPTVVDLFSEEYPWVENRDFRGHGSVLMTKLVRSTCFRHVDRMQNCRGRQVKADCIVQTKDMTSDEFDRYREIIGRILEVLNDYQIVTEGRP